MKTPPRSRKGMERTFKKENRKMSETNKEVGMMFSYKTNIQANLSVCNVKTESPGNVLSRNFAEALKAGKHYSRPRNIDPNEVTVNLDTADNDISRAMILAKKYSYRSSFLKSILWQGRRRRLTKSQCEAVLSWYKEYRESMDDNK